MADPTSTTRIWFFWMTTVDGSDHAVTDEEMARGTGAYLAMCGASILPASLSAPPEPRCRDCVAVLRADQEPGVPEQRGWRRLRRRPGRRPVARTNRD